MRWSGGRVSDWIFLLVIINVLTSEHIHICKVDRGKLQEAPNQFLLRAD